MGGSDRNEVAELIHRRAALLGRLDDAPAEKPVLTSALKCSRSTVDRAVRELESREYVSRGPAGYETTLGGRLASQEYQDCLTAFEDVLVAADLLAYLPPDAPFSPALLRDAEIHYPKRPAPRAPLARLRELIERSDRYRGFATVVLIPGFVDYVQEFVDRGELELEFIYDDWVADHVREEYVDQLEAQLGRGRHRMLVVDEVPYGFGILSGDRTLVYLVAEGADGEFRGLLINDSDAAVAWAESLYDQYRARAEEVTDS